MWNRVEEAEKKQKAAEKALKATLIGCGVFSLLLCIAVAIGKKSFFLALGEWFVLQWKCIVAIFRWTAGAFASVANFFGGLFGSVGWGYVPAVVILLVGLAAASLLLYIAGRYLWALAVENYKDSSLYKKCLAPAIALALLCILMFFSDSLVQKGSINIISIWFILSDISAVVVFWSELSYNFKRVKVLKNEKQRTFDGC